MEEVTPDTSLSVMCTGVEFTNVKKDVDVPVELSVTESPEQTAESDTNAVNVIAEGCVMVAEAVAVQLLLSVTVTV
jgi:hypothetical protein